ncbi:SCO family protein [Novosphingobium sp. PASSN1]|uniref:SCO family protein n=1 Tax=Novosphingobium sp. PASSN1 TaxID=2015561 RepID=UPI000BD767EF|nr:SCO family protein [Novosphingobium sp. PASSN1]OYU34644.1 MAG: SCO family protein [Novosphingobium sp. PASSN1]
MNRRAMDPKRPIRFCLALLGAAALLTLSACGGGAASEPPLQGAAIGGDFTLVDKTGKTVRAADFKGRYTALYFGYTFCPDVCPLDVQVLMQGYRSFAKAHPDLAAKVTPLFVTIDPARDKPEVVGQFAAHFGKDLIGLTGSDAQIAQIAKSYGVYYKKGAGSGPNAYLMDHSRAAYLMGPEGQPIALLPVDANAEAVAAEFAKWVR